MASRKEYEMLFQLDAKLGSSYTSTFSKAKSGPSELQKEIRSLQSVQADISAYTKQQAAVEKTQAKLDNLNKQYQLLQQEIKETSGPTTSLERESAKLEQRIGDTSNALAAQKEKLGATAKSLNEAGVGTDNLGSKSQDLADKLNTLRAKEEAAAESAEEYGDKGTSSIEAVSQAFAAAKVYEGLEQIKDAYMDCINSAGDFEASMSNVEALSGASGDQLQALTDKAKEMGATTKFTAGESADALSYMALAGWDTQSMLQGISPVMELAAAANMDLASASDIVTDYLTAFCLTASDTTHFVDVMAYAMSHSNTNVEQLGEAYKACAATAKSMGYSVEETTAVLATMANAGVKGGEAGTALNAIMTRLATNTKGCADELEKYGVSIYDSQGNMNSLSDILTGLSAVWDNLTDQEQANLAKTIAGTNQYSKLQTIMAGCSEQAAKGGQSFSDYASALENCSGTAGKMAGTMLDNLNGKMTLFESAADGLEIAVGEQLTPAMSDLYEVGADVLSGMTEFVNDNPGVVKGITTMVGIIGTATAGLTGYVAVAGVAKAVTAAIGATAAASLGPVALAVAGVAAVTGAFVAVTSAADAAVEASGDWPPALDEITTAANGVTNALDDANATMQASAETTMATAGTADLYITKLEEMGDYAKLSADDQQEYRNVLTLLCDLIPDLAGYIDTTTGEIQGGTTALRGYAKAWQDSAKAQAYQEFMSDVSQQYNDVTKELYQNQLKLTEAQTKGEAASKGMDETYQKLLSTLGMTDDEFQKTYGSVSAIAGVHLDPEIADEVMDLRDSYEEYSNQQLEAAENEKVYQEAVDDGIAKQGEAQQAIEDAQTAYENLEAAQSGATSSASEGAAELGQAISDVTVEAQKLVEAYNTAYDAAEKSIGGQYEIWDKASSVSATSVDTLNKNLESQTTYWQDYNTNLDTLREKAGSIEGLSDMVAGFADGSKESVDAIAGMAQAAQDGGGKLEAMVKNWQDLQQAQKDASGALADLTTDFSSKMDELAQKAGDTVDELDMSAEAAKNGKATVQAFIDSASNMLPDVQTAYAKIGTTAANALQSKLDKANTSGRAQKTGAQATGTRNAEPGWTLVGEYGPEIVYMQGGEGVLNAAQTKDVLPALDDRYTDTRAENAEAPAPKETAQAAESAAVNPHEGMRNDTRAAQTPATTARVMPQTADGPAEAVSAPAVNQPKVDIPQEVEAAQEPVSAAVAADVPDTVSAAEPFSRIPENSMQYAETVQAEDAYPASAAQPAAEAAAFAPAEADKVDIPLDGQTPENGLSAAEMNHAAEADAMLADYTAVISPRAVDAMGSFAAQNAKPAAEAVQAESAKSSTTTQLQPMSLSPVFQISGMQDSQQLRSALNQSVEDMRQMILDVVQSAREDEERMNFS